MRKLLLVYGLLLLLATSASAQRYYHGGGGFYGRPRVSVGIGIGPYFPAYPFFGYSPFFGYPPYGYGYPYGYSYGPRYSRPTKLEQQIQDIRMDYNERIYQVKHDKSIKRKERKRLVHELEHERDKAIIQAQRDYYEKPQRRHNFNSNNN